jgi:hypothetical protein
MKNWLFEQGDDMGLKTIGKKKKNNEGHVVSFNQADIFCNTLLDQFLT